MKRIISLFTLLLCSLSVFSQELEEADFVGNVRAFTPSNNIINLDKTNVQIKVKATGSKIWWGIGSSKQFIEVPGPNANTKIANNSGYKFIVKAANNSMDPSNIVMLFKLEKKGKNRRAQMGKVNNAFGNSSSGFDQINFEGKKYTLCRSCGLVPYSVIRGSEAGVRKNEEVFLCPLFP